MTDVASQLETLETIKSMLAVEEKCLLMAKDDSLIGGLLLALTMDNTQMLQKALEAFVIISQHPQCMQYLKKTAYLQGHLFSLRGHSLQHIQELASCVYEKISQKDCGRSMNCHDSKKPDADNSGSSQALGHQKQKQERVGKPQRLRRRNSIIPAGKIDKSKPVTLQIRGIQNRDDLELCRNCLVQVSGVVTIIFNDKTHRVNLRISPDLKPVMLAQAIAKTMTMSAELVSKDEQGNEVLTSFSHLHAKNIETEKFPDYPEDSSPVRGDQDVNRVGDAKEHKAWGFVKYVGNVLSNSFYW